MVDSRFFHNAGAVTLQEIVTLTGAMIASPADGARAFLNVAPLDRAGKDDISFLDNVKYVDAFSQSKAGACFVRPRFTDRAPKNMVLLATEQPYYAFALTARRFYPATEIAPGISPQAVVAKTAKLSKGVCVEPGAVIGENVVIGEGSCIGANTVIGDNVEIGEHCRIGALCTITHTLIGHRALLHRGIHIGQDGFGFAVGGKGIVKVPQLGRVIVGDDVEIGAGTCIDRGTGPDTLIGSGTKIDNLVQIGHNVQIGKNAIIVAQVGISGSAHIGDGVMLGGQAGIAGHVKIGAGSKVAAKAGVTGDIPAGNSYGGYPAVPIKEWHRQSIAIARLPKKKASEE